jgi:hypothetical protein
MTTPSPRHLHNVAHSDGDVHVSTLAVTVEAGAPPAEAVIRRARNSRDAVKSLLIRAVVLFAALAVARSADADATPLLRVFLTDGTTLSSYGEYARVGDRVVFSIPFGEEAGTPRLQVISLAASRVDWERTDAYRDASRAARYATSQGEADFAALSGEVASVLNEVALADSDARRLALIEQARRRLTAWPADHYDYRAKDVREIVQLLDEALSELRASTGTDSFDLNLVAMADAPPGPALLADPGPAESIAQALTAADLVDDPVERERVLTETLAYIDRAADRLDPIAARHAREFAVRRLDEERRANAAYSRLRDDVMARASAGAAAGNVAAVEKLLTSLDARDAALGRRRPGAMRALYATLRDRLDATRRLRLARDQWRLRSATFTSYSRVITRPRSVLDDLRAALESVKALSGPDVRTIGRLADRAGYASRLFHTIVPPSDLAPVHALFLSASDMAWQALHIRLDAARSGDMPTAWSASSAASGALMLIARADADLDRYLAPPSLP